MPTISIVDEARKRRDIGIVRTELVTSDNERDFIDQLIRTFAMQHREFSANDIRPLLPELKSPRALGARFLAAARAGVIKPIGFETTTGSYGHAGHIRTWVGAR